MAIEKTLHDLSVEELIEFERNSHFKYLDYLKNYGQKPLINKFYSEIVSSSRLYDTIGHFDNLYLGYLRRKKIGYMVNKKR